MSIKVLILSASIGMGHVRAAQALEQAFIFRNENIEVRHEDAMDFANPAFRNLCRKSYVDLANTAPELLGWLYEYSDKTFSHDSHGNAFERLNAQRLIRLVKDFGPDIIVCTHSLPADMISWLICKHMISAVHGVVITDFDVHQIWLCHHYSRYFVALDETKEHLIQLGFEPDRITVSGIPVAPIFAKNKGRSKMRIKHGLAQDFATILISSGGMGLGPMVETLSSLLKLQGNNQIVAACGSNDELKERMEQFCEERTDQSNNIVKVIGFTSEMDEYMEAADLILGKPGGLMSSEALIKGLVFVIVSPIPGQEERNADHLVEEGAAIRCNNLPTLAFKVNRLLSNPKRLDSMRKNALALAHPHAAEQIARELIDLHKSQVGLATHPAEHQCNQMFAFSE